MSSPFAPITLNLAHSRTLELGPRAIIMAILNVTPDSFSDGGRNSTRELAVENALRAAEEGADIIDIGGESTRPGAQPVSAAEEEDRVLAVIEALRAKSDVLISIDTYRAQTAKLALAAGAHIVNDVYGLQREPEIAAVVAKSGAGVVIMHTGREREKLADAVDDQKFFLKQSLEIASMAGVEKNQILLDPGFGFAKETPEENLELIARFEELHEVGFPLLAGTSRKRFLGAITGRDAQDRGVATAATNVVLRMAGAAVFRVHDVAINRDALMVTDAMLRIRHSDRRG